MQSSNTGLPQDLITLSEGAKLLPGIRPGKHMHVATLWRMRKRGKLPAWRIGRNWFISRADVLKLLTPEVHLEPAVVRTAGHQEAVASLAARGLECG